MREVLVHRDVSIRHQPEYLPSLSGPEQRRARDVGVSIRHQPEYLPSLLVGGLMRFAAWLAYSFNQASA